MIPSIIAKLEEALFQTEMTPELNAGQSADHIARIREQIRDLRRTRNHKPEPIPSEHSRQAKEQGEGTILFLKRDRHDDVGRYDFCDHD